MADYYVIPTNIGEAKMANALALGTPLAITELALGDGEGSGARGTPIPNPEAVALVSERRRAPLNSFSVDPDNANVLIAEQVIPETVGGWWIREMGLYDQDGDMIFVCNTPPTYKPQLSEGSGRTQVVRMASIVSDTAAVTLKVDPSVVLATRKYVQEVLSIHAQEFESRLNQRTIYLRGVADLIGIAAPVEGAHYDLTGYRLDSDTGGGRFYWDSSRLKSDHDGGTVISNTVPWQYIPDFLKGVGETNPAGSGCFIRLSKKVTIEDFGAFEGQTVSVSTAIINHAIEASHGRPVYVPARRYKYNGVISSAVTTLIGERMPNVGNSRSSLENGSIFEGTFLSRSIKVHIENLGVDHGSAAFPTDAGDAFKVSPATANTGKAVNVENIVGLGRAPEDQYHAVLIEGYANIKARNIIGVRTYYGAVIKGVRVNASNITTIENGLYGGIIKADTASGDSSDIVLKGFIHDGMGASGLGLQIESSDDDIRRINVSGINVRDSGGVYRVAGNVLAGDIVISDVVGSNISGDAIRQTGLAYSLSTSNIALTQIGGRAINMADVRHLSINGVIAAAADGNTTFATDFILIGASSRRTNLLGINLNSDYSSANGSAGMIKYDNLRGQNIIGEGFYKLTGVGAPVTEVTTISTEPAGTTSHPTYKVAIINANYTSTGPKQFNLTAENTPDGHLIAFHNNTGGTQVVDGIVGGGISVPAGTYVEFIMTSEGFVKMRAGAL
ncbi:phage tail protein [Marinobacter sp. 1-3A]|uniref:phage tail protein n=1 Tax=Marinobacter sp. 1-3A TaxID=2582920 RepID=UPI00190502AF|nr:phage tail protein [Marinobacter sp. 1-3A]MBK1874592.1 phage tail protein [Marinobacter sp. 1-3A]